MARTISETLRELTTEYLDSLDMNNLPGPHDIEADIIDLCTSNIKLTNALRDKNEKWKIPTTLSAAQIGLIISRLHSVRNIQLSDDMNTTTLLAIYQTDGYYKGLYVTDENMFARLFREYSFNITTREIAEVISYLKSVSPTVKRCQDKDLIAVNNGIFNYDTKTLMDFDPEYVFITKSHVDYNPNASNIIIHNDDDNTDWDIESWMNDLSDNSEIVTLLWEIIGAIIRPNVKWDKSAWFYSNKGNNGKGTLCLLMRNIAGQGSHVSISLTDFSKDFMMEPLLYASSVIVDENDVGTYIDKCANLKAVITNDTIQINRKFKTPIPYQFKGFMVQCLNEYPRIKDTSDSFYRRQLFIKFDKCFTGKERKYIKNDYLQRPEVLEYVLFKVLNMNYYRLSEPQACSDILEEYKQFNDPIRDFLDEVLPSLAWDMVPFSFLYDLYKVWFAKNSPSGKPQGRNTFMNDIKNVIESYPDWKIGNNGQPVTTLGHMVEPEPLIGEYNLIDWMNKNYTGDNPRLRFVPTVKASYRSIIKV